MTEGDTVLVSGVTGGVGALAVQLAVTRGARVIATARPGAEADFVTGLTGAEVRAVDYTGDLKGGRSAPSLPRAWTWCCTWRATVPEWVGHADVRCRGARRHFGARPSPMPGCSAACAVPGGWGGG